MPCRHQQAHGRHDSRAGKQPGAQAIGPIKDVTTGRYISGSGGGRSGTGDD